MRPLHRAMLLLLALPIGLGVLLMLAAVSLSWRLAQGPLPLPWLAGQLEQYAETMDGRARLRLANAALVWEGFRAGVDRPLEIQLTGVALLNPDGSTVAQIREARVSLSIRALLQGRVQPRAIELVGPDLRASRRADGTLAFMLTAPAEAPAETTVETGGPDWVADALATLARPPVGDDAAGTADWLSQLRLVRVRDARLAFVDAGGHVLLAVPHADLDLRRRPGGGLDAQGSLDVALGATQYRITAAAVLPADGGRMRFTLALPQVVPASLADALPDLEGLSRLDLPVEIRAEGSIDTAFSRPNLTASVTLGAGRIGVASGLLPVLGGRLRLEATADQADLVLERLELGPTLTGRRPQLGGWLHATRADGRIDAAASLHLDRLDFADLPGLWPVGVGGKGLRPWLADNITDGTATGGHVDLALTAPEDFSDVTITHLAGGLEGQGLTIHWLRPIPPAEAVDATLRFLSPDALEIAARTGRQVKIGGPGPPVTIKGGRITLSGLAAPNQFADIEMDLAGPVPEVLAVLRHPRLKLLDRKPIDIRDPAGQVAGKLSIDRLPLEDDVDIDLLRIRAETRLTALRLGGIVGGRDLEAGTLDLEATNDGLRARGTATLAGIPGQVTFEQDFRSGPPTQVVQKGTVSAVGITPAQLLAIGVDTVDVMAGTASAKADLILRRNGRGELAVKADLAPTILSVPQIAWSKPAGKPATADFRLLLDRDRISSLDRLRAEGEGWAVAGDIEFAAGRPRLLRLQRLALGPRNLASGEVRWPTTPDGPWGVTLSGPSIDASAEFDRRQPANPDHVGPPWIADMRFEQVVMAGGAVLRNVAVRGESNGRINKSLRLIGRTQGPGGGELDLTIAPDGRGRTLTITAADAGALLRAIDIERSIQGGQMRLTGRYDDTAPGNPLSGRAEITGFAVRDAPALAKLLQAMSVYGVFQALRGGDMNFDELIAPFRLTGDILELDDARSYNVSLGMTAKGRVDLARQIIDAQGTIVPAYAFNSLLGRIPLLGKLVSPEEGGGLFAATWSMRGPLADPDVGVNPLAAVTPGFLRGIFGIFRTAPLVPAPGQQPPDTPVQTPQNSAPITGADGR